MLDRSVASEDGRVVIDLDRVNEVRIRVVGGDVNVGGTDAPPRLEVECLEGEPVEVTLEDGVLTVEQRAPSFGFGIFGGRADFANFTGRDWSDLGLGDLGDLRHVRNLHDLDLEHIVDIGHTVVENLGDLCQLGKLGRIGGLGSVRRSPKCSVSLTVPPRTAVDVRTVSATTFAAGLAGDVSVKTVSGPVTATFLSGAVEFDSVSADVEVEGVSGRMRAHSVSGNVTVAAGSVTDLAARSVSGELTLDLDPKPNGHYECQTTSGDVALRLPPDANVDVDASSMSGRLDNAYTDDGETYRRRMRVRLGTGGANLRVRTLSGDIALLRRTEAMA